MHTWIVLIRGINVGGRVLPMARLVERMEAAGCSDVRTYIQSGNALCRSEIADAKALATKIGNAILASEGYEPKVMVLSRDELAAIARANPYPVTVPKAVHVFFLSGTPTPEAMASVESLRLPDEQYTLAGKAFYFYTPAGFGPSKLAAKFEKLAKVDATARNWNTVQTLLELADAALSTKAAPPVKKGASPAKAAPPATKAAPRAKKAAPPATKAAPPATKALPAKKAAPAAKKVSPSRGTGRSARSKPAPSRPTRGPRKTRR